MKKHRKLEPIKREDILRIFSEVDAQLVKKKKSIKVKVIGGVPLILQNIRERATMDIDIAPGKDAVAFQTICSHLDIPVDIITISSTVDLQNAPGVSLFKGKALEVNSVTPEDLIKLKLERFRKQDPEDIYAIIEKSNISYKQFREIVRGMRLDFIGNLRELLISAMIVVETMYPENKTDFEMLVKE
jgi:hypothetical protein